ncbi:MAG: type II toxin-antitoxin system PemK/MazF family toxin [Parafilimonas sp.]
MQAGDIVLIEMLQSDGNYKLRPALILKPLPKYNDFLVCGISTQIHQYIKDFDEILNESDFHFTKTGLNKTSLIRLSFIAVVPSANIFGSIGKLQPLLLKELLQRLSTFLVS